MTGSSLRFIVGTLLVAVLVGGCALARRGEKFLVPDEFVAPPEAAQHLATLRYESGYGREPVAAYDPVVWEHEGTARHRPELITWNGWFEAEPEDEPVHYRLWIRHTGLFATGFRQVVALTGGIRRGVPNELRFLPNTATDQPLRIAVRDLGNVYGALDFVDGDLILLEVLSADGLTATRALFRYRDFGLRVRFGSALMVPFEIPAIKEDIVSSPAIVASVVAGYRFRARSPVTNRVNDLFALVGSVGVGSTLLEDPPAGTLDQQVVGAFNAVVAGAGVQMFDIVSVQVLFNVNALFRDGPEAAWTPAVGVDAVRLSRFFRSGLVRLFQRNELTSPPPRP